MDVDQPALPPGKLLQIKVELRLDGAEPYRAGLDPVTLPRKSVVSVRVSVTPLRSREDRTPPQSPVR